MRKLDIKNSKGFTIIEVLIVLAIAGLILIVVLLAVPALQRNSRNTTIKNDASSVAGGIGEYQSNNNGNSPASVSLAGDTLTIGASGSNQATVKVQNGTTVTNPATAPTTFANANIYIVKGTTCGGTTNPRATAIWFSTETSSTTPAKQCLDS